MHAQKPAQLRYKWLLMARLLFLLFLILAFAQPFLGNVIGQKDEGIIAVYIDNSQSMSLRQGQRSLLDVAKQNALQLIRKNGNRFIVLSNDKILSYKTLNRQQAVEAIQKIEITVAAKSNAQIFAEASTLQQEAGTVPLDLYYLSDFQQTMFSALPETTLPSKMKFIGVQIAQPQLSNYGIDTAYFENPILQNGQSNKLIVKSYLRGEASKEAPVLQLSVNGQVKAATRIVLEQAGFRVDTLVFQPSEQGWQKMILHLNDQYFHQDDSFAIAAKSSRDLTVLLLDDAMPNLFLQTALRSYSGFKVQQQSINSSVQKLEQYNLVLINALKNTNSNMVGLMRKALQNGQNVCLFVDEHLNVPTFNKEIAQLATINLSEVDTTAQTLAMVQNEHALLQEMFERMPENVQLPFAAIHFPLRSGLDANQQSVFSFRNGDPFLAVFSVAKGKLYLCTTPPLPQFGNFQNSYFFVPFLYQMASQAKGKQIFAIAAGQKAPVWLPQPNGLNTAMLHIKGPSIDMVPSQKAEAMGVQVYVPQLPFGFYEVTNANSDTNWIGVNNNRMEMDLSVWLLKDLKKNWKGDNFLWQVADSKIQIQTASQQSAFPLWKLCAILALAMLGLETWMLSRKQQSIISSIQ